MHYRSQWFWIGLALFTAAGCSGKAPISRTPPEDMKFEVPEIVLLPENASVPVTADKFEMPAHKSWKIRLRIFTKARPVEALLIHLVREHQGKVVIANSDFAKQAENADGNFLFVGEFKPIAARGRYKLRVRYGRHLLGEYQLEVK